MPTTLVGRYRQVVEVLRAQAGRQLQAEKRPKGDHHDQQTEQEVGSCGRWQRVLPAEGEGGHDGAEQGCHRADGEGG